MKSCKKCGRTYNDNSLNFCLEDGEWLFQYDDAEPTRAIISGESLVSGRRSDTPTAILSGDESRTANDEISSHTVQKGTEWTLSVRRLRPLWVAATAALIVIVGGVAWQYRGGRDTGTHRSISLQSARISRLTSTGDVTSARVSPDGKFIVHVKRQGGRESLWLRQVDAPSDTQIVPPTEEGLAVSGFSRDGAYVYFVTGLFNRPALSVHQVPLVGGTPRKILDSANSHIAISPDGRRFAYALRDPNSGDVRLMTMDADGSQPRIVATRKRPNNFVVSGPAWSPDGRTLITGVTNADERGSYGTIVEIDPASGTEKLLTDERWLSVGFVQWLPDKSGILFLALDESANENQIWHLSYPDGALQRVTNDLNNYTGLSLNSDASALVTIQTDRESNIWTASTGQPVGAKQLTSGRALSGWRGLSWTPDARIVYTSQEGGITNLFIANGDGSQPRQLTTGSPAGHPAVSSDSRYIVFRSNRAGSWSIWRMDIDGGNWQQLSEGGNDNYPEISPDGRWVVFSSNRGGPQALYKVSINGGELIKLSEKIMFNPAISTDGKWIACHYREGIGTTIKLAILPFDGGDPVRVFDLPLKFGVEPGLHWTIDGKAVLYPEIQGDVANIWSVPLDGSPRKQLTDFKSDEIFQFDLSPDGRNVAIARGKLSSDVILFKDFR